MKIILLQDVPKIGKKYDIKNVPDGYARNFLFPKKLAEPATLERIKFIEEAKALKLAQKDLEESNNREAIEKLKNTVIKITREANSKGHLYEGVSAKDIKSHIEKLANVSLGEEAFVVGENIKSTGTHTIKIKLGNQSGTVTVEVRSKES